MKNSITLIMGLAMCAVAYAAEGNRGNMVSDDGPLLWQSQIVGLQETPHYVTFEGKQIPVPVEQACSMPVGGTAYSWIRRGGSSVDQGQAS